MAVQAVLFDIGATLVTGPPLSPVSRLLQITGWPEQMRPAVSRLIMCRELAGPDELCRELEQLVRLEDGLPGVAPSLTREQRQQVAELWQSQRTAARLLPGARNAVLGAKTHGFKVGLVSNIWPPYYASFCTAWPGIEQQMDALALSFRVGVAKPDPRLYQHALAVLQLPPQQVWMVGDTYYNDILPAIKLGMRTAWVLCRADKEADALRGVQEGRLPAPDLVVPDLRRLDFRCCSIMAS